MKIIGHPELMRALVSTGMRSRTLMEWVLRIMANLLRPDELGPAEAAYRAVAAIARLAPEPPRRSRRKTATPPIVPAAGRAAPSTMPATCVGCGDRADDHRLDMVMGELGQHRAVGSVRDAGPAASMRVSTTARQRRRPADRDPAAGVGHEVAAAAARHRAPAAASHISTSGWVTAGYGAEHDQASVRDAAPPAATGRRRGSSHRLVGNGSRGMSGTRHSGAQGDRGEHGRNGTGARRVPSSASPARDRPDAPCRARGRGRPPARRSTHDAEPDRDQALQQGQMRRPGPTAAGSRRVAPDDRGGRRRRARR